MEEKTQKERLELFCNFLSTVDIGQVDRNRVMDEFERGYFYLPFTIAEDRAHGISRITDFESYMIELNVKWLYHIFPYIKYNLINTAFYTRMAALKTNARAFTTKSYSRRINNQIKPLLIKIEKELQKTNKI